MISKRWLLIIVYILIRKHLLNSAKKQSFIGNTTTDLHNLTNENIKKNVQRKSNSSKVVDIADLYNFDLPDKANKDANKTRSDWQKQNPIGNILELYNFQAENYSYNKNALTNYLNYAENGLANVSRKEYNKEQNAKGNIAALYDFPTSIVRNNQMLSREKQNATTNNIEDLINVDSDNSFCNESNKSMSLPQKPSQNLTTCHVNNTTNTQHSLTAESIAELYFFSSPTVMGMYNCSYENTINISSYAALPNGSYIYDNHTRTIIPPDLVGNYDYEILYDGSKHFVPLHKRACICRLKLCITLCSHTIIKFYQDFINAGGGEIDNDFMNLFNLKMTLTNKTVVTKNIARDFAHIVFDEFCEPFYTLSPEKSEKLGWTLYENGTLLRHSDLAQLRKNEYCFELYQDNIQNETYYLINPLNCAKKRDGLKLIQEFHYWTQVLSIPFFLLTIIAYFCLPELKNVHGKCFMTYLSCLTTSYSLLSYINLSQNTFEPVPCLLMGYLNHYMQLSQYTWLGIICIDTWKSFSDYSYKASYHKYALYGYHLPLLMTFLTFVAQNSKLNESLKPGISENRCGLEVNKWAASIYLYGPCLIILVCCLISFILTSRIIKTIDREVYKINELQFECPRVRYTLYLRLFLMMGLSWFLDIVSYFLNMFRMKNLSELIDYVNALQGLYIFVNFIGRRRVRNIIRERFCKKRCLKSINGKNSL